MQGSGTHASVMGSQAWLAPHNGPASATHGSGTQAYPASGKGKQTSSWLQVTLQPVASHLPSSHCSPALQFTLAQESKHPAAVKSAFGLQACFALQLFGSQGSSTHLPRLQTSPALQAGKQSKTPVPPPVPLPAEPALPPDPLVAPEPPAAVPPIPTPAPPPAPPPKPPVPVLPPNAPAPAAAAAPLGTSGCGLRSHAAAPASAHASTKASQALRKVTCTLYTEKVAGAGGDSEAHFGA